MNSQLNPYLSFDGDARQAMTFYQSVFGGNLEMNTFAEFQANQAPEDAEKIMHSMLEAANGITFMASDTPSEMEYTAGANISMSLSGDNEEELSGYFEKLAAGGQIVMPLEQASWGDKFGMCVDQFGVSWMVNIAGERAEQG